MLNGWLRLQGCSQFVWRVAARDVPSEWLCDRNVHEFLGHDDDFLDGLAGHELLHLRRGFGGGFQFGLRRRGRNSDDVAQLGIALGPRAW